MGETWLQAISSDFKEVNLRGRPNQALHLTAFSLRSKATGELGRYVKKFEDEGR